MSKFHNCNAQVDYIDLRAIDSDLRMHIIPCNERYIYETQRYKLFTSYYSKVAIMDYDNKTLWLLPRWDFSPTTTRQVTRWASELLDSSINAKMLRSMAKNMDNVRYAEGFATSYLHNCDYNSNVNWKTY